MPAPLLRFTMRRMMAVVAVTALLLVLIIRADRSGRIIEDLSSPVAVAGWSEAGLELRDGRTVSLVGVRISPELSTALTEATRHGVELGADGRVYGLVRVHHWCGNDPIREHIARVDLARLMTYLGPAPAALTPGESLVVTPGGRFTTCGWNVSEFYEFQGWCRLLDRRDGPVASTAASQNWDR